MGAEQTEQSPKLTLVNTVTGDARTAQFNPEQLEEALGAVWARLTVPGLSHTKKHFTNTEDVVFSFNLFYNCLDGSGPDGLNGILEDRKFLYAMTHPRKAADGINRAGAPRVIFIWPTLISLTCIVTKLVFTYTLFNKAGAPVAWNAKVTLEEIRDGLVTMEDILNLGTNRAQVGDADANTGQPKGPGF